MIALGGILASGQDRSGRITLVGHRSRAAHLSVQLGRLAANTHLSLALTLPLRNQQALKSLIRSQYDPESPECGEYLTSQEFAARFGPTKEDYRAVVQFARGSGLRVVREHSNRTLVSVEGSAAAIERAFSIRLMRHRDRDGREFYAPDDEPSVPAYAAARMRGVVGLSNAAVFRPAQSSSTFPSVYAPATVGGTYSAQFQGGGSGAAMGPDDIRKAYNLQNLTVSSAI
jgi:subtilase family serine protease